MTREEAIKEIKTWDFLNDDEKEVIETLIPELKESEDERIRKEITELVMQPTWKTEKEFHRRKELCAWLEKQGKNNMGISKTTKQELEDNLHKALEKETSKSWNEFLEKQGEQNPAAWSEEDEKQRRQIERIVGNDGCTKKLQEQIHNWFNTLKDRVQPQNAWKPSKEQMHYLYWIANIKLGDSVVEQEVSKHLNELYNDLKKLREE